MKLKRKWRLRPIMLDSCLRRNDEEILQEWQMDNTNVNPTGNTEVILTDNINVIPADNINVIPAKAGIQAPDSSTNSTSALTQVVKKGVSFKQLKDLKYAISSSFTHFYG